MRERDREGDRRVRLAAFIRARTREACRSGNRLAAIRLDATTLQLPSGVTVPPCSAQNRAMLSCAAVRVSEILRTSARSATNFVDPNAGGAPGRNWLPDLRKKVWACPRVAKAGGVAPASQHPSQTGTVPVQGAKKRSPWRMQVAAGLLTQGSAKIATGVTPGAWRSGGDGGLRGQATPSPG